MLAAGAVAVAGTTLVARSATEARAEARAVADLRQAAVDAYASAAETSPRVIAVASEPVAARATSRRPLPSLAAAPDSERRCLAEAIYFEANGESEAGQRAVAAVILNRTADPRYPKTICGVVYQGAQRSGCQFSFACDGIQQTPAGPGWNRARRIADQALAGAFRDPTHGATHFHATYVAPGWANRLIETAAIGLHVFYRYPGFGRSAAAAPARPRSVATVVTPEASSDPADPVVIAIDATPTEAAPIITSDADGTAALAMTVEPTPAAATGPEPQELLTAPSSAPAAG